MKDHIHTIPVLDALREARENGGCPFCLMRGKLERNAIDFVMGPSYMEDDVRMETNRVGFCARHLQKMYANQNRLGLALMLHTHLQRLNRDIAAGKNKLGEALVKTAASCYVCSRVDDTFGRYVETFFHLWGAGGDEARLAASASGYCLPHFALILNRAEKAGKKTAARFKEQILPAQLAYMKQMEEDLEWFTQKFDYRNADAPWKNSKDALPRAVKLLTASDERDGAWEG